MRNLTLIIAAAVVLLLPAAPTSPPLENSGFEEGWHLETTYWTLEGGPFHNQFIEITPPVEWTAWWIEGPLCAGTPDYRLGRPEVRVIGPVPDPTRVRSGEQAAKFFTFWRCHQGGLYQQVAVEEGRYYAFSVFAHSWFSNCSTRPHDVPYDYDCVTLLEPPEPEPGDIWAQDWLSVGIDPTGGTDPRTSTVEWGQAREIYGVYSDEPLRTGRVRAQGGIITVFFESEASHPLKHDDVYLDDASLRDVTYQVLLPAIMLEGG